MPTFPHNRRFTPAKTGETVPLGHLERGVMQVVWRANKPLSVADVHETLVGDSDATAVAYTTVKTTMERLADKGILVQTKAGKAYLYHATLSEADLERRIVSATLDRLIREFPQAVASFFVRPDPDLTSEQLSLLKEAIEQSRQQNTTPRTPEQGGE
jgi:predicted transcriptional regulator